MVFYEAYKEFFRDVIFADELEQAKAEVEARGKVLMAIRMGRKYGHPDYEIISDLSSELNCSHEEATNLFQKYDSARQTVSA